ncbi:hypothetical protein [Amycolatopsis suaedae]|uniref:hypothetical protein n=1 Tax=Amycolatopsis suaedae TaxID=2510978 RepID=UPI001F0D25B2|nr:hypothetical protein [Amycolatopsis suaedae]
MQSDQGLIAGLHEAFAGQRNGLCGAAEPGALFLVTGLHTGKVGFSVEWHDEAPPAGPEWEEIVEASFRPSSSRIGLCQWAGEAWWDLDLPLAGLRVRYCASGMDAGRAADTRMDGEPRLDRYLLQFWPGEPAPDRVVRQTGETAAYWHGAVRDFPSAEELAERRRQARLAEERAALAREREYARRAREQEVLDWGGRPPTDRLRAASGYAQPLAALDRGLVDAIADAAPEVQRAVARLAVRRAYDGAGLTGVGWVAPALAALDDGGALPAPFDDQTGVWNHLFGDPAVPSTVIPGSANFSRQAAALPAIFQAGERDPLRAALDAVWTAQFSFGTDREVVLGEIRALAG